MELAKEFGVAANIDFPLPATFIVPDMFTQVLLTYRNAVLAQRSDDVN
ncbi:hypothetical protein OK016_13240 [Vibrio chagasii]|nr:hypothetical protein [Vibrio chagasii]